MANVALSSGTCGDLLPAEPYNLLCVVLTLLLLGVVGRSLVRLYATYRLTQVLAASKWQWLDRGVGGGRRQGGSSMKAKSQCLNVGASSSGVKRLFRVSCLCLSMSHVYHVCVSYCGGVGDGQGPRGDHRGAGGTTLRTSPHFRTLTFQTCI
jgi:hypothetical protein